MQNGYCELKSLEGAESGLECFRILEILPRNFLEFRIELNKGGQVTNWKQFWFITATLTHTSPVRVQPRKENKVLSYYYSLLFL